MEKIVQELRKIVPFKDNTSEGDVVLIAMEKPKALVYAIVTKVERDEAKKGGEWWSLTMQVLSVPPQETTWILREPQFTGKEIFTMGNEGRFMQAINLKSPVVEPKSPANKSPKSVSKPKTTLRLVK
jgi:hypothetical protein